MNEEEEKSSIKERVSELTTINFSITKCPEKVFQRFTEFCKKETGNNYSFGLKLLLDGMEGNIKEALLFEQYIELKAEISDIKALLDKSSPKPKNKTFGNKLA